MAKIKVGNVNELQNGEVKKIEVDDKVVLLVKDQDQFFAIDNACTHAGCSLEEFGNVSVRQIECTCHGSKFDLKTGQVTNLPAQRPLKIYPVKIEGSDVFIEI